MDTNDGTLLFDVCFQGLTGYIEMSVGGFHPEHRKWICIDEAREFLSKITGPRVFFGPAIRTNPGVTGKNNCHGSLVCWTDVDHAKGPLSILPPTLKVWSGHGWHLYWRMLEYSTDVREIEQANMALAKSVRGDSAHNIDRLLRVPGTINIKDKANPTECRVVELKPYKYSIKSLSAISLLSDVIVRKIITGDSRGYPTKSERDWAIIRELIRAGVDDSTILIIFKENECGDKYRDPQDGGDRYLKHSISQLRQREGKPGTLMVEKGNCYYAAHGKGTKRISTFTLTPTLLLDGGTQGDSICADVRIHGSHEVWPDVVFPKEAFTRVGTFNNYLPRTSWVWLGNDAEVRLLLAHLSKQIQEKGLPVAKQTHVVGYHQLGADSFFVSSGYALSSDGTVFTSARESPIVYVPTGREAPSICMESEASGTDYSMLARILPQLNTPDRIWPLVGWFMATPMKVRLAELGYKFPILNVCGTRGSGKTTLVHKFLEILGYQNPCSYDVGTTKFVMLSLMGSTNAIPISFSEFRGDMDSGIHRYIRLAYDIGKDARGRPNQTTVEYPLMAPFSVDGEDKLDDPAILERSIVVMLSPQTVLEGEPSWEAFQVLLGELDLDVFARPYLHYSLCMDAGVVLDEAEQEVKQTFPDRLPDRIRRNLTVAWFGVLAFGDFMARHGVECRPSSGARVLGSTLENVYSLKLKRAPVAADAFVEFVANAAARGVAPFPWVLEGKILWFQCAPAYDLYAVGQVRQRRSILSKSSMVSQLYELKADYITEAKVRSIRGKKVLAFGIDLEAAHQAGLDIPQSFNSRTITVDF